MKISPDIYVYKMVTDNGGAPCVYRRVLSLAICKPKIRKSAKVGSIIFGFGAKRLSGRLIYVAVITEKPDCGKYYSDARFFSRPDCVYRNVDGTPKRIIGAKYHADFDHSETDVGGKFEKANVLISKDFRYFGEAGTSKFGVMFPLLAKMVAKLGRGHRVNHTSSEREELLKLKKYLWKKYLAGSSGKPSDADKSRRCNT